MNISIIVPIHNGEKYIARCLSSLLNQSRDIDEIILVNDHSSDNSKALCMEYVQKCKSVKYFESKGYGVSAARNTGLEFSSGDIISFCDIDDIEKSNMSELINYTFENNPCLKIVISGFERVNSDISQIYSKNICRNTKFWKNEDYIKHTIYDKNVMGTVCCKFFSSDLIQNIRFDESLSLCEDMDFVLRAMAQCNENEIKAVDSITYCYSINPNSVTNDETKLYSENDDELKYNHTFLLMANNDLFSDDIKEYLYYQVFCFSISILTFYDLSESREYILKKHIKEYSTLYFKFFWLEPFANIKRGIKCILRIRKRHFFCW